MSQNTEPTVDWTEARRLAEQSIRMGKLIIEAINANQPRTLGRVSFSSTPEQLDLIINAAAKYLGYQPRELFSVTRTAQLAFNRHIVMFFCREMTKASAKTIARKFKCDHGTVLHAVKVVQDRCDTEPKTQALIADLRNHLLNLV